MGAHSIGFPRHAQCTGLVETSNNLASVAPLDGSGTHQIVQTTRSSISAALTAQRNRIARLGKLAGAKVTQNDAYPGAECKPYLPMCSWWRHLEVLKV